MVSLVVAIVFGVQCNDRYWMPRPDQNFLSWGFGFLIISAIFALGSGVCLFWEGQKTYDALLRKEDEYTNAALEMSAYPMGHSSYPPIYEAEYDPDGAANYDQGGYAPNYGPPSNGPSFAPSNGSHPSSYEKDAAAYEKERLFEEERAGKERGNGGKGAGQPMRSFERPSSESDEDRQNRGYPHYLSSSNA